MICKTCGKETPEDSKFCVHCGSNDLKEGYSKEEINAVNEVASHKLLIIVLIITLIMGIVIVLINVGFLNLTKNESKVTENENLIIDEKTSEIDSKSRPYAIMISNNQDAWPQCGIQDAYLVYEIIVEGGITRMMALYKDQETAKIGVTSSARRYFMDYAKENDAIFIHWGGSPQAYAELESIDSLDGIQLEGSVFFRDTSLNRALEHTGFVDLKKAKEYGEQKGYNREVNKRSLLNYSIKEIDMYAISNARSANIVTIKYSDNHSTSYEYDSGNKVYKRSMSGEPNIDLNTGKQYTAKNIIAYKVRNYTSDDKGRQELDNIGTGTGYYITEGKAIPITWEKNSYSEQTIYRYENGNELKVNEGNTFIQIYPVEYEISIL